MREQCSPLEELSRRTPLRSLSTPEGIRFPSLQPKCGFLPTSDHVAAGNRAVKASHSRYQMHQALKFSQGQVRDLRSPPHFYSKRAPIARFFFTPTSRV